MAEGLKPAEMPEGQRCPIGPLQAHTYNYERTECIWCGPNHLAWKPGVWVRTAEGFKAWSAVQPVADPKIPQPSG